MEADSSLHHLANMVMISHAEAGARGEKIATFYSQSSRYGLHQAAVRLHDTSIPVRGSLILVHTRFDRYGLVVPKEVLWDSIL